MNIYQDILTAKQQGKKLLAVLIDPEKIELHTLATFFEKIHQSVATHIFVGGSTDSQQQTDTVVAAIKKQTQLPVLLFPGDHQQITNMADGILFLSLLSGRNPKYLIEQQIAAVPHLQSSALEVIPTGYLLIDGGNETAVQRVSQTQPIPQSEIDLIVHTALAGTYLGKKLIYLEAGSGAIHPVNNTIINKVAQQLQVPLIVGGGIRNKTQLQAAFQSGADLVVIGTAFEKEATFLNDLKK